MLASLAEVPHGKFGSVLIVKFCEERAMKSRDIPRDLIFFRG
jgi:hypothetical protein